MKATIVLSAFLFSLMGPVSGAVLAAETLPGKLFDAPVMPGGAIAKNDGVRIEIAYDLPYERVLAWYKEVLKNYPDEKYRDWDNQMYIEDQGGAEWHSIGIAKGGGPRTTVTIVKDNWTWIFSTLFIRFAGVFIVLICLMFLLMISSVVMRAFIEKGKKDTAAAQAVGR